MDTQSPHSRPRHTEGAELHGDPREIGEHQNRGLGMVGGKMGAEGRWRDAGASRWVRHLTAFSEGRGPLGETDLLGEDGFQGEMFGGFWCFFCVEGIGGCWYLLAPQLGFMNVSDFMNEVGFFRWLAAPCGFFFPTFCE